MQMIPRVRIFATVLLGFVFFASPARAEDTQNRGPTGAPRSVQEQIDALKEGQERILKEIEEIKALLKEKSGRTDLSGVPAQPPVFSLRVQGEPFRGDSRARIAVIEYSDFECSYCARYVHEIFPLLEEDYIKPGKVKYFFRDMPAREHTNAVLKAQAARCAGEQGKFWEMHDRLFANQQPADIGSTLSDHAEKVGADKEKFNACLASGIYGEQIRQSVAGAKKMGIYGTPAFVIGVASEDGATVRASRIQVGGESYDAIKEIIDELLATPVKK